MRTQVIDASDIDEAADLILQELLKDDAANVIYFDGWDGLGASTVLRRVAGHLNLVAKADELVIHIDCSKWESTRAMQRMIAKHMKIPDSMMKMFDEQDEEDNFQGVPKGSRTEIPHIADVIHQHIQKQYLRFFLIFHNGSNEEINLNSLGFPLFDRYSRSKVLWSFQGRFRAYPRMKVDEVLKNKQTTYVLLSANSSAIGENKISDILHHEAEEVAHKMINVDNIDWYATASKCFLYMVKLGHMGNALNTDDNDMHTHVCNYWRCDGIIQLQQGHVCTDDGDDRLWLSYDAFQSEMRLDVDKVQNPYFPSSVEKRLHKRVPYWVSTTYGFMPIPDPLGQIPNCMFQQFNKLCVLKLSSCMFSFRSPPFLCCDNLRFLWLDHCQDGSNEVETVKDEDIGRFFGRLWVLDVRYSNKAFLSDRMVTFMTQLRELNVMGEDEELNIGLFQGKMNNIRKLRVTKSKVMYGSNIFSGRDKLELLEFSEINCPYYFSVESWTCSNLETIIISGPTNLSYIFLAGCANKLKNIFLSGSFPKIVQIEITGAAVETLDLSKVTACPLSILILHACGNLCSILWPLAVGSEDKSYNLTKLHIDTIIQKEGTQLETSSTLSTMTARQEFDWYISVRDARILRLLESIKDYFGSKDAHVEISSPTSLCGVATGSNDGGIMSSSEHLIKDNLTIYSDVTCTLKAYGSMCTHVPSPMIVHTCSSPPNIPSEGCYIHIEDNVSSTKSQTTSVITLPRFVCDATKILQVHNSFHITSILAAPLGSAEWNQLEWCQVERCPNLECVFNEKSVGGSQSNNVDMFRKLRTFWGSHLPNARNIWNWSDPWGRSFFRDLTMLHIDFCPRLVSIINVPAFEGLNDLETIEIMWCGDLSVAFHYIGSENWDSSNWESPNLKHIRLHELPKLQNIFNTDKWIPAPNLETIKVRGCWNLRKLPVVDVDDSKVVECDCEKEWWDRLEWESAEHAALYKPTHPRHYKKTMIRSSVLR